MKKGETEEERRNLKDMINDQTNKLTTEINDQTLKLKNEMNRGGKFASVVRQSSQRQGHLSTRNVEHEEDKNGEMLSAIKSIISQLKEQRTEIEDEDDQDKKLAAPKTRQVNIRECPVCSQEMRPLS